MISPTGLAIFGPLEMNWTVIGIVLVFVIAIVVIVGGGFLFYKGRGGGGEAVQRRKFEWVDPNTGQGWNTQKEKEGW